MVKIQRKRKGMIMARHGENIRKRKDGRWEGRYGVYDQEQKRKRYHSVYGRSYDEAKKKLTERKNRLLGDKEPNAYSTDRKDRGYSAFTKVLFSEAAGEWLMEVKAKRKPSTYVKYLLTYQKHLEHIFRETPLTSIADAFAQKKISDHLSLSMQKSVYCVLNQILKFGSRKYSTPILALKRPEAYARKNPVNVFSRKEQARLISALYRETDRFKLAVLLCLHTGLRLGELCALKWEDIDFENQMVIVSRTVQRLYVEGYATKTVLLETLPKSDHSRREIPLVSAVLEQLWHFRHEKEYIFGGDKALEPRTMQNYFRKMLQESGVEYKNFHTLRHTFSTNCIEGGTDVKSLSEVLGHSDVQITLNRYVHPSMDTKRRHLDTLSAFYGQIHGQIHGQIYGQVS